MSIGSIKLRITLLIFALLSGTAICRAEIDYGLMFRSYETTPSERTSLDIPAEGEAGISFNDSLRISFSLKVNLNISRFGYICRAIINGRESIDILLYTPDQSPTFICATGDHMNMIQIGLKGDSWQDLSLLLVRDGEKIKAVLNETPVAELTLGTSHMKADIRFGKISQGPFETSDVAPMVIKNLSIRADGQDAWFRKLKNPDESVKHNRFQLSISNPVWYSELNCDWKKLWETDLGSVSYIVPDNFNNIVYFVSGQTVTAYDLVKMSASRWQTKRNIKIALVTDDFIVLPDGTLTYLDLDSGKHISFNRETHDWEEDNPRTKHSVYLHGNFIYDKDNDRQIHLFGYGHHRYYKDVIVWDYHGNSLKRIDIEGINPRYLAAAGMNEGKIYIYSGKGNVQGAQELGTRIYGDLICLDVDNGTSEQIWEARENMDEVAARDLLFEDNRNSFIALTYNPNEYHTALQLKRFHKDGSVEVMARPIPYNFLDIESEARLIYCSVTQCYYAVIVQKADNGLFHASIHSILSPIQNGGNTVADAGEQQPPLRYLPLIAAAFPCLCIILFFRRRSWRKRTGHVKEEEQNTESSAGPVSKTNKTGIYLLDGFKVITASGENITASFTPLMKQLLSIIILYSAYGRGISNTKLKETLWMDKSDDSYNNNRGVTLKRIRTCLEEVDDSLNISSDDGKWYISNGKGYCDFLTARNILDNENSGMDDILRVADMGLLLPDTRLEWLDSFKGRYESEIISRLTNFRKEPEDESSAVRAIRICDAILRFDDIDESSIRIKCKALIIQKHFGTAKKVFDSFRENYQRTLDEEFSLSFNDFLNTKEN